MVRVQRRHCRDGKVVCQLPARTNLPDPGGALHHHAGILTGIHPAATAFSQHTAIEVGRNPMERYIVLQGYLMTF